MSADDATPRTAADVVRDEAFADLGDVLRRSFWNDPRRRDDRSGFLECERCGSPYRWIENLGSAHRGRIPIVARVVTTGAVFDAHEHVGLVAVFPDRTGFTIGHDIGPADVDSAFLYACHWDTCEHARRERDRLSQRGAGALQRGREQEEQVFRAEVADHRYTAWLRERATQVAGDAESTADPG